MFSEDKFMRFHAGPEGKPSTKVSPQVWNSFNGLDQWCINRLLIILLLLRKRLLLLQILIGKPQQG